MASLAQDLTTGVQQADLIAHAAVALGRENAMQWLQTPQPAIGQRTPLDVLLRSNAEELQLLHQLLSCTEDALPDRQRFTLNAEQWAEFQAALDAPPRALPRMSRLLNEPSVLDPGA